MRLRIITSITLHNVRPASRPSPFSTHGRNHIHKRNQLGDIVSIRPSQYCGQGIAISIGDHMVFRPGFAAICGISARRELTPERLYTFSTENALNASRRIGSPKDKEPTAEATREYQTVKVTL